MTNEMLSSAMSVVEDINEYASRGDVVMAAQARNTQ